MFATVVRLRRGDQLVLALRHKRYVIVYSCCVCGSIVHVSPRYRWMDTERILQLITVDELMSLPRGGRIRLPAGVCGKLMKDCVLRRQPGQQIKRFSVNLRT